MTGPVKLSTVAFDRAALHRTDEDWLSEAWARAQVLVITPKSATPATDGGRRLVFRTTDGIPDTAPRRFLGLVGDQPYFTATIEERPSDGQWLTLRDLGMSVGDLDSGLLATAIALEQWHQRHTHCPLCGARTVEAKAGWIRVCPHDDTEHFPRTDPAVIMLITDDSDGGDLALLGNGAGWGPGRYSTLAGFVEPGESLEAAVAREVFEEVGVHVKDVEYVASQPWPFPSSLMLGFSGRLDGDRSIHLDPIEIAEAGWFTRAEVRQAAQWTDSGTEPDPAARLRSIAPQLSISRYLIDRWLARELP